MAKSPIVWICSTVCFVAILIFISAGEGRQVRSQMTPEQICADDPMARNSAYCILLGGEKLKQKP